MSDKLKVECFLEAIGDYVAARQDGDAAAMRKAAEEAVERFEALDDWQPIESAPTDELGEPFLVLLPGNSVADAVVLQVSVFEGRMYPDGKDGCIDWKDAITTATHWRPRPALPQTKEK